MGDAFTISQSLQRRGLIVRPAALDAIQRQLRVEENPQVALQVILKQIEVEMEKRGATNNIVEADIVEAVVADATRNEADVVEESVQILPAFRTLKYRYDPSRRTFSSAGSRFRLHSDASARVAMLEERLAWVAGTCARNELFRPPLPGVKKDAYVRLHRVDELPSLVAAPSHATSHHHPTLIHLQGMLTQPEDGVWCLEDGARSVALEFMGGREVPRGPGYFTETCVIHATGEYDPDWVHGSSTSNSGSGSGSGSYGQPPHHHHHHSSSHTSAALTEGRLPGCFRVHRMDHPPSEPRRATLHSMAAVDTFGVMSTPAEFARVGRVEREQGEGAMFAIFSDVHCDDPGVMAGLGRVLEGFQASGSIPTLFILMGNFTSRPSPGGEARATFTAAMKALAEVLARFPEVLEVSQFLLVPGPSDPGSAPVLPRPPLPDSLCAPLLALRNGGGGGRGGGAARITLSTNPCRLRFFTKEMVVFRGEVTQRLARGSVVPPLSSPPPQQQQQQQQRKHQQDAAAETAIMPPGDHVAATLLRQGHLLPLSPASQPVYWEYDHALRLSPTPHAIFIGEDTPFWQHHEAPTSSPSSGGGEAGGGEGTIACPGSFSGDKTFAVFRPSANVVEVCDLDPAIEEEEGEGEGEGEGVREREEEEEGGGGMEES